MVESRNMKIENNNSFTRKGSRPGYYRDHTNDTEHFDHFYKSKEQKN